MFPRIIHLHYELFERQGVRKGKGKLTLSFDPTGCRGQHLDGTGGAGSDWSVPLPALALTSCGLAEGTELPGFNQTCAVHTLNLLLA